MSEAVIRLDRVSKEFRRGELGVRAVDSVTLSITPGEFVAIMGKSGSGKSTLMHLMSGLLRPTSGRVELLDEDLSTLSDDQLTLLRRNRLGYVFQFFNLLPTLTAVENVALPLLMAGVDGSEAERRALAALSRVELSGRARHRPDELSGGQMQRVAIARALVTEPPVIFADEPTGNLDSVAGEEVLRLLKSLQVERGQTVLMVTHDPKAAAYGDRMITMRDGRVIEDLRTGGMAV